MKFRSLPLLGLALILMLASQSLIAAPKDEWILVRSRNFTLIGNASEKDIRRVALKLEQFRETFRLVFSSKLDAPIPTNVIVFKNDSAYRPFKPKRADGKTDDFIAGYFQPGDDVNYITLSAGGTDANTFGTIFHEYVHFIVDTNVGKANIPAWFNEGLAEYYQTFEMEDDIKAKLGMPQNGHLALLQQNKLMPLASFFNTSNAALHGHGSHSRSIFYAQAWAVMHYLIANKKTEGIDKFMAMSIKGPVDEAGFQSAFQMTYSQMEKELRQYVTKGSYMISVATFEKKITVDSEIRVSALNEAESNAYLGDLLYHNHRPDDAEPYLTAALAVNPDHSLANTALGMVKVRQRKYPDAKKYLDKAIAKDPKNHIAYYQLAYLLSRDAQDEFGYVSGLPAEKAERMRELLKRAVEINPTFTESYELLAFISIVTNDKLDEGVAAMIKALKYRPGNQRYTMRIAELYLRQDKTKEAGDLAARLAKATDDPQVKQQADQLLQHIAARNELTARNEEARRQYEAALAAGAKDGGVRPYLIRRGADGKEPTPEEVRRQSEEFEVRAINRELRKSSGSEIRLLGKIEKIDCKAGKISYSVTSDSASFTLTSKDFQGLHLASYVVVQGGDAEVGCEAKPASLKAVLTYLPHPASVKAPTRGELLAIEFVPPHFKILDPTAFSEPAAEALSEAPMDSAESGLPAPSDAGEDVQTMRRNAMFEQIRNSLRKPGQGERRVFGFIERSECSNKGAFFFIKADSQLMKLNGAGTAQPEIRGFTPEIENLQIGCGMKAVDVPVVVTYREAVDKKNKTNGDLVALEFVPRSFVFAP